MPQPEALLPDEEKVLSKYRSARAAAYASLEVVLKADIHDSVLVQVNVTTKDRPLEAGKPRVKEV